MLVIFVKLNVKTCCTLNAASFDKFGVRTGPLIMWYSLKCDASWDFEISKNSGIAKVRFFRKKIHYSFIQQCYQFKKGKGQNLMKQ